MSDIKQNIQNLRAQLPSNVCLVAVSKTHPNEFIEEAYEVGQRDFGENKVQELSAKASVLPKDIRWHMIGHLQTNKVKYIAPFVHLIHAVDSEKLLTSIDKEAKKCNRIIDCLLQIHIAQEETKFGLTPDEARALCKSGICDKLTSVRVCGLMTVASNTDDQEQVAREFATVKKLFDELKSECFANADHFCQLSMGMSHDYPIAIQNGATMIRIGSSIFGNRYYPPKEV